MKDIHRSAMNSASYLFFGAALATLVLLWWPLVASIGEVAIYRAKYLSSEPPYSGFDLELWSVEVPGHLAQAGILLAFAVLVIVLDRAMSQGPAR